MKSIFKTLLISVVVVFGLILILNTITNSKPEPATNSFCLVPSDSNQIWIMSNDGILLQSNAIAVPLRILGNYRLVLIDFEQDDVLESSVFISTNGTTNVNGFFAPIE